MTTSFNPHFGTKSPMKIFIAGASGTIGQVLIPQLVKPSYTVTALSRTLAKAQRPGVFGGSASIRRRAGSLVMWQPDRRLMLHRTCPFISCTSMGSQIPRFLH